jgi:hypothetical protein
MSGTAPPKVAASSGQPAPSLPNATPSGQAVTAAGRPTVPLPPVPLAARHDWAAPLMCLAALASIAIPWIESYPFSPLLISLPFTAGLSATVMAVWSAVLWLLAARTTDTLPNTAAAGLSGGAALFGAGTVSILQQRLDTSPIPASHWAVVTHIAECAVSGVVFITVLWSWSPAKVATPTSCFGRSCALTRPCAGDAPATQGGSGHSRTIEHAEPRASSVAIAPVG